MNISKLKTKNKVLFVPLKDAERPHSVKFRGRIIYDSWWVYHPIKGIMFSFQGKSVFPQCNVNRTITEMIIDKLYNDDNLLHPKLIEKVHTGQATAIAHEIQNINDYIQLMNEYV